MTTSNQFDRRTFVEKGLQAGAAIALSQLALGEKAQAADAIKKVRVGVIGCGSVSTKYFPHLSKSPYVELVSTCDIIPERAVRQAMNYGVAHHYPHIDQMLAGEPFDMLVNLTDMQEQDRKSVV